MFIEEKNIDKFPDRIKRKGQQKVKKSLLRKLKPIFAIGLLVLVVHFVLDQSGMSIVHAKTDKEQNTMTAVNRVSEETTYPDGTMGVKAIDPTDAAGVTNASGVMVTETQGTGLMSWMILAIITISIVGGGLYLISRANSADEI